MQDKGPEARGVIFDWLHYFSSLHPKIVLESLRDRQWKKTDAVHRLWSGTAPLPYLSWSLERKGERRIIASCCYKWRRESREKADKEVVWNYEENIKAPQRPFFFNPIATATVPEGTKIVCPRSSSSNIFGPEKLLPKQEKEYFHSSCIIPSCSLSLFLVEWICNIC